MKQAEAEVVPSSSFVEVEVKAGVDVEVEVDATLSFRHSLDVFKYFFGGWVVG